MQINHYSFGRIVIDNISYDADLIIFPDRVRTHWWRKEGHKLHPEDIQEIIEARPKVLVVGQGAVGEMKILPQTRELIESQGIKLLSGNTEEACQLYNQLPNKEEAIAAFHLTC